jgi:hypothetical protein
MQGKQVLIIFARVKYRLTGMFCLKTDKGWTEADPDDGGDRAESELRKGVRRDKFAGWRSSFFYVILHHTCSCEKAF